MNSEQAKQLRAPFQPEKIGKLPKGSITLDYVGHAEVTDRLLEVDPDWTWQPMATDEHGMPLLDAAGGLWIKLTVCGITRPGYGEASGGFSPGDKIKSAIGDAIRNAAMRFGVALDLWTKDDQPARTPLDVIADKAKAAPGKSEWTQPAKQGTNGGQAANEKQIKLVYMKCKEANLHAKDQMVAAVGQLLNRELHSLDDLFNGEIDQIVQAGPEGLNKAYWASMGLEVVPNNGGPQEASDDDPWAVEKW